MQTSASHNKSSAGTTSSRYSREGSRSRKAAAATHCGLSRDWNQAIVCVTGTQAALGPILTGSGNPAVHKHQPRRAPPGCCHQALAMRAGCTPHQASLPFISVCDVMLAAVRAWLGRPSGQAADKRQQRLSQQCHGLPSWYASISALAERLTPVRLGGEEDAEFRRRVWSGGCHTPLPACAHPGGCHLRGQLVVGSCAVPDSVPLLGAVLTAPSQCCSHIAPSAPS